MNGEPINCVSFPYLWTGPERSVNPVKSDLSRGAENIAEYKISDEQLFFPKAVQEGA